MACLRKIWEWIKKYWQFLVGGIITLFLSIVMRRVQKDVRLEAEKSKSDMSKKEKELFEELRAKERENILDAVDNLGNEMSTIEDNFDNDITRLAKKKEEMLKDLESGEREEIIDGLKEHLKDSS